MEIIPFILVVINIIVVYLYNSLKVSTALFSITLLTAFVLNTITFQAVSLTVLYAFLIYNYYKSRYKNITFLLIIVFSLLLATHKVPGFNNFEVFENLQLSSNSIAFSIWLNFDKVLIALMFLMFAKISFSKLKDFADLFKTVLKNYFLFMFISFVLVSTFGTLNFDFKFISIDVFVIWFFKMLFFTVIAEELFFRYFLFNALKEYFHKYKNPTFIALLLTSVLFGIAHFGGGINFVILAMIAGYFYGRVYILTNKIESAILLHFLVNLTHLIFFAYPISS